MVLNIPAPQLPSSVNFCPWCWSHQALDPSSLPRSGVSLLLLANPWLRAHCLLLQSTAKILWFEYPGTKQLPLGAVTEEGPGTHLTTPVFSSAAPGFLVKTTSTLQLLWPWSGHGGHTYCDQIHSPPKRARSHLGSESHNTITFISKLLMTTNLIVNLIPSLSLTWKVDSEWLGRKVIYSLERVRTALEKPGPCPALRTEDKEWQSNGELCYPKQIKRVYFLLHDIFPSPAQRKIKHTWGRFLSGTIDWGKSKIKVTNFFFF